MHIKKFLGVLLVYLFSSSIAQSNELKITDFVGTWGRDECQGYIHKTELSPNGEYLKFTDAEKVYYYYIVGLEPRGLKVVMLGESRFDVDDNPVTWFMVMKKDNQFYWLRSDREDNDLRGPLDRCIAG